VFATKRLRSNAKKGRRNLNVTPHAKRTRIVKTKISQRNVHALPKQMKERNAKVLRHLKARRNAIAIVSAKKAKPDRQFQNQALLFRVLCNL